MSKHLILALAVFVGGCMSVEQQRQADAIADDQQCRSYGAQPGSPAYVQCRTAKDAQRDADRATLRAALIDAPGYTPAPVAEPALPPLPQ